MNGKDLLDGMNHVKEEYIQEAQKEQDALLHQTAGFMPVSWKVRSWQTWAAAAACLLLVLGTGFLVDHFFDDKKSPVASGAASESMDPGVYFPSGSAGLRESSKLIDESQNDEIALATGEVRLYFPAEDGSLQSTEEMLDLTAENIFEAWCRVNQLDSCTLIRCFYEDNGYETQMGDTVSWTPGDWSTVTLTVSSGFEEVLERENADMLVEALRQTFQDYMEADECLVEIQQDSEDPMETPDSMEQADGSYMKTE